MTDHVCTACGAGPIADDREYCAECDEDIAHAIDEAHAAMRAERVNNDIDDIQEAA